MTQARLGTTLVELLVVIVLLGLMSGVVAIAIHEPPNPPANQLASGLAAARDSAMRAGHATTVTLVVGGSARAATAFPDGRVIAEDGEVDPRSGRQRLHAR